MSGPASNLAPPSAGVTDAELRLVSVSLGESTDLPIRSPSRGPPYWKSKVLRQKAMGDAA